MSTMNQDRVARVLQSKQAQADELMARIEANEAAGIIDRNLYTELRRLNGTIESLSREAAR